MHAHVARCYKTKIFNTKSMFLCSAYRPPELALSKFIEELNVYSTDRLHKQTPVRAPPSKKL